MKKQYVLLFVFFLGSITYGFSQIAEFNFSAPNYQTVSLKDANVTVSDMSLSSGTVLTNITTGAYFPNEPYIQATGGWTSNNQASAKYFNFTITADAGYEFTITNISFRAYATGAGPSAFGFAIGTTDLYAVDAPNSNLVLVDQPVIGQTNLSSATIRIQGWLNGSRTSSGGGDFRLDDVVITGIVSPIGPNITVSPSSVTGLDYTQGAGPSTAQSFDVNGFMLAAGIDITAPSNFEIATAIAGPYADNLNIPAGIANGTNTIYIRLKSGLTANTYSGTVTMTNLTPGVSAMPMVNVSGEVSPPLADVVISEIMYDTPGANDYEWIELCNLNATAQDVSNYTIDVLGTTEFTFPAGTSIAANSCITVLLGYVAASPAPECPFTPDYANPIGTTNILTNTSRPIELVAPNSTVIDVVTYSDGDGANGNGSTLHVIDATLDNSDTNTNWQEVNDGGSPGVNTLVSPCSVPELQLEDSTGTNQACGAFTLDLGSVATGYTTDLSFDIDNEGTVDLNIASLVLGGANSGEFSVVSPAGAFVVTPGNTQTITVRFAPLTVGSRTATLTINNNDSDEGTCVVDLLGTGTTPEPEINVEGNLGSFPDIANGDITPSGTDNTLFAAQFIGSSQEKTYRIQNTGTANLDITSLTITGANPGDFTVSIPPAATLTPTSITVFEISFSPLASGLRMADVTIANNDSNENPYTFRLQGTGKCIANTFNITPEAGPAGTIVTVTGSNLSTATASFNGIPASVTNVSATHMEVEVPAGAMTGNLEVIDDSGCPGTETFTVINNQIASCEGGANLTELFISEITDATYGSLSYIEIYNGTGANIDLSNYAIRIYINGNTTSFQSQTLSGTINAGDTYVLTTGTTGISASTLCATPGGDGSYGNLVSSNLQGVNKGYDEDTMTFEHDFIGLYNSGVLVDAFGVFGDDDWMETIHTSISGTKGFNFRRLNTITPLPNTTFDDNEWNIIDWAGSGSSSCVNTNNYSNIGIHDFSTGIPPNITVQPLAPITDCESMASITLSATEGFIGSNPLIYQWFFSAPGDTSWTAVSDNAIYSGATAATLNINNTSGLNNYQYYCQVREDGATCYTASIAVKLEEDNSTTWDGASWSNGIPDINTIVFIDGNYTTSLANGSFSACQLFVSSGNLLTVTDGYFVQVNKNVEVTGDGSNLDGILIESQGSFIQRGDGINAGSFTLNANGYAQVTKRTAPLNTWFEYTYWSSPVTGETIGNGLNEAHPTRRYWFNAQNFLDQTQEMNNDNSALPGQDDNDDNGDDWQFTANTDVMIPGIGYAATHAPLGFTTPGSQYDYTFTGALNTGDYSIPLYRNDIEPADNNWNLIGNPYPSAIDADAFLAANAVLDQNINTASGIINGAIFLWSHSTPLSNTANGNDAFNFSQSDYAVINGAGQTAGGDGIIPTRYIPSGQGFFVALSNSAPATPVSGTIQTANVVFNNSMRSIGSNDQFFRTSITDLNNKLWVNLSSDNGIFNQTLITYLKGATNADDGMFYDAPKNLSTNVSSIIYSSIDGSSKKFAIQSKEETSLNLEEVIAIGFETSIEVPTLYSLSIARLEGAFFKTNTIYLLDRLTNTTHNLTQSNYSFTSAPGEFNERFAIVFDENTLSIKTNALTAEQLKIVELNNGDVSFSISKPLIIDTIDILDITGKTVYRLKGTSSTETYTLSKLSQAAYIARVKLSNGKTISKRAIKRF